MGWFLFLPVKGKFNGSMYVHVLIPFAWVAQRSEFVNKLINKDFVGVEFI